MPYNSSVLHLCRYVEQLPKSRARPWVRSRRKTCCRHGEFFPLFEFHTVIDCIHILQAAKNAEELKGIEERIADAKVSQAVVFLTTSGVFRSLLTLLSILSKENLGDMEVRDFLLEKSEFYARIGDKVTPPNSVIETSSLNKHCGDIAGCGTRSL